MVTYRALNELQSMVERELGRIEYPAVPSELYDPIRYTLESGGKRLRPAMLLATYDFTTGGRDDLSRVLPAALAVEVFHNFTLLHDDIMDRSALRRGRATVWDRWGANVAILSGDAMTILAYQLLARTDPDLLPGLLSRFNQLAMGVCQGQQWDMMFEQNPVVTLDQYLEMVRHKTADLFEGSVRMGAHAGGASEEAEELLGQSAREMGIAFQLQDDWLDVYGETEIFGKQCGDDIADNKQTYLSILAREQANESQLHDLARCAKDSNLSREEKIRTVMRIYDSLGVRGTTARAIEQRIEQAEILISKAERMLGGQAQALRNLLESLRGRAY